MDVHVRKLAAAQVDVVAHWQLRAVGLTRWMIEHRARTGRWLVLHPGVYKLNHAPLTWQQRWFAAALTTPDTALSHAAAAACWGFLRYVGPETVTRPGNGGPRRTRKLVVHRSMTLDGEVTRHGGIPITAPERTLIDIARELGDRELGRAFREAIRLRLTTARRILATVRRHDRRRGTTRVRSLALMYSGLPYERTRSNAEALALEVLHDAGVEAPLVNTRVAGEEADLVWPRWRLIVEIDGPQYHRFRDEDARKEQAWVEAGCTVRRISSDDVYDAPERLVELVNRILS